MKKIMFFILFFSVQLSFAALSELKFYKNEQYVSKVKVYEFSQRKYFDSSDIIKKLGGKVYWYSVSGKMIVQLKSHKISIDNKSDLVKYDDEVKETIGNPLLIRGGKIFISQEVFLTPSFSKVMGFRMELSDTDKVLKMSENINISSFRYFSYKDKTRFVIYLEESLEFNHSRLQGGKFVASIINGSYALTAEKIDINDGVIKSVYISQDGKSLKITADLSDTFSDYEAFTLKDPDRIVFDFKATSLSVPNRIDTPNIPVIAPDAVISTVVTSTAAVLPDKISTSSGRKKIVIDAGHGGKDPGGRIAFGMKEKELNLDVAKKLYEIFRQNKDFDAVLTRDADIFIPLNERSQKANSSSADLFISIHGNASKSKKEKGFEIYFLSEKATDPWSAEVADYENSVVALEDDTQVYDSAALVLHSLARNEYINEGSLLASQVALKFQKKTPFENRGIKQAAFYVLRGTYAPGILVEMGFMTNYQDQKNMNDSRIRKKIAESIYEGVIEYAKKKEWIKK